MTDRTIVPLNMAEPILVLKHRDNKDALGFAPHGAGRNVGRKAFLRENEASAAEPASMPVSTAASPIFPNCPEAYKNAAAVRSPDHKYGIGEVIDEVDPLRVDHGRRLGTDAPWRKAR